MGDGHLNKCIACAKKDVIRRYQSPSGRKKARLYECERNKTPERKAATDGKVEIKNPLGGKTPSERLRGVLFVLWKQKKITGTYDEFYVKQMDTVIQSFKDQLEPET